MINRFICTVLAAAFALESFAVATVSAAPTAEQRQELAAIQSLITKAANFYLRRLYKESAEAIREAQQRTEKLAASGDADVIRVLQSEYARLGKAHALLELEGIQLPPLEKPEAAAPAPLSPMPAAPMPKTTPAAAGDGVSFVRDVAPLLVTKCGRCHVADAKGKFSMATFADLKKGSADGVVIFPGDAVGSRLVEIIESGDMPRGGGKVSAEELATLKKWIAEGAKFDGANEQMGLATLASGGKAADAPKVSVVQATGKETVSFARDIAPVLSKSCAGCHGTNRPRNNFSLFTFQGLLKGGDSGAPVLPGKPAESLLVKKLKGTADGDRMPQNQPPLDDAVIAKIEKWIEEGATFDGPDAAMDIGQVAALFKAQNATHEELSQDRVTLAVQNWALGMPNIPLTKVETKNFVLVGNIGENTLTEYGQQAETVAQKIAAMFKAPADKPFIKGRMTLFFFQQRYDYSEFGQMVEQREIPRESRGHWRHTILDVYGAVIPATGDEFSDEVLLGQQIAGAYIANLGKMPPRWFSEGAARAVAAKLDPKDSRVAAWNQQISQIIGSMAKPDDFLTGQLPPESADVASYSFVKFLMTDTPRFNALIAALRNGEDFAAALANKYGGNPQQLALLWARRTVGSR